MARDRSEQLRLTEEELILIGFAKKADSNKDFYYEIETLNGCFYYKPNERFYVWYHKTVIGGNI